MSPAIEILFHYSTNDETPLCVSSEQCISLFDVSLVQCSIELKELSQWNAFVMIINIH